MTLWFIVVFWVVPAITVFADAQNLGVERGCLKDRYERRFFNDLAPLGWGLITLIFGLLAVLVYLTKRPRYVAMREGR